MPDWTSWSAGLAVVLLICTLTPLAWLLFRRMWLSMGHGRIFACSLKRTPTSAWMVGVARFQGDTFQWFRVFSPSLRPKVTLHRDQAVTQRVHKADGGEGTGVFPGHTIVELGAPRAGLALAMARPDLTAFTSWTEASPPGAADSWLLAP